jgi:hypothetical protein
MRSVGVLRGAIVLATVAIVLAGCGGSDEPLAKPKATSTVLKDVSGCIKSSDATLLHHEGGGVAADVALFGHGGTTAIVTYEINGTVCTWVPLAERLASEDTR